MNNNLTKSFNDLMDGGIPITIYDAQNGMFSKVCSIPYYFYNKCFNL